MVILNLSDFLFCHMSQFQNYWLFFVKILFFTHQNGFDVSDAAFS